MVGAVVSCIVTVWIAVAVLLDESVAVHVTVVLPSENDTGVLLVTDGFGSALSVAVALPVSTDVRTPVASDKTSGGAVSVGGMVSASAVTVTVWVAVAEFW